MGAEPMRFPASRGQGPGTSVRVAGGRERWAESQGADRDWLVLSAASSHVLFPPSGWLPGWMGPTESRRSLKIDPPGLAAPIKGGCVYEERGKFMRGRP